MTPPREALVTVITCTYNRAHTLPRVYNCLCQQTHKRLEWIVADDGSADGTQALVRGWTREGRLSIRYFYQPNSGKHFATNRAVAMARGEYLVNLDADDAMAPNALEVFLNAWASIPEGERSRFMAVKARCLDGETGRRIGRAVPGGRLVSTHPEATYRYKLKGEGFSMVRTEVKRQYPAPEIRGLRFYPEGIWQDLAARRYKILFIGEGLRLYYRNEADSLLSNRAGYNRSRENRYLWAHILNDNFAYFWRDPFPFFKAMAGVSMEGFFLNRPLAESLGDIQGAGRRLLTALFVPVGYACYRLRRGR